MDAEALIRAGARSLDALAPALEGLERHPELTEDIRSAERRGYFTPEETETLRPWFARYLSARGGLLETIEDLRGIALTPAMTGDSADEEMRLRSFVVAYAASSLLVQAARHLVTEVATASVTQRKLNEADLRYRIPRKQYTNIYRSLTRPLNAYRISEAMRYADANRAEIQTLADDPIVGRAVAIIAAHESVLRVGVRQYLRARLRYRWHSWRRRRASAMQQAMFGLLEVSGRLVADVRYRRRGVPHRVEDTVRAELAELLKPGDVFVTRHDDALTNLFLPGFWPHAALHVGSEADRAALGLSWPTTRAALAEDPLRVLEAKKDGVLFRPLTETLAVDAVAIIRPNLEEAHLVEALTRVAEHEGKLYNFDFDFFTDDKLVCTEVVYRAYDGVGQIQFSLTDRAGRKTFSAEDLLDMAVDEKGFTPVAVFGGPGCENRLVLGDEACAALARTYRSPAT